MTARRELVLSAGRFPAAASTGERVGTPSGETTLATSGYLSSLLPLADRAALREINVRLTRLAIDQCGAGGGAANQIDFGTPVCLALADFVAHGVCADDLLALSRDYDVVFPWSLLYGNARTPFNCRLVRLPLAIAFPRTVDDVVFWVSFVRRHGFSVSIRSGNNSYEGLSSSNEVVIDLTFLTLQGNAGAQFEVDTKAGVVHVASGVRLGVLYTELAKLGLAVSGGQCAPVCVGGLVGTGGVGFSTREFGFACDQLEEVQWVLVDGRVVVANAGNEHADLYRATKGAGAGGLGVMTRLTLRVVPAVPVLFYVAAVDLTHGAEVMAAWQNLAATAPDALSSIGAATASMDGTGLLIINGEFRVEDGNVPAAREELIRRLTTDWFGLLPSPLKAPLIIDIDELKTSVEGRARRRGDDDDGRPLLAFVELTTLEAANAVALVVPMPTFNQWKLKSKFTFRSLTAADLKPVFEYLQTHAPADDPTKAAGFLNPLLLGGKSNRIDPDSAVVPAREGAVLWIHAGALWNDESVESQALAFVDGLWAVLDQAAQSSTAFYGCPDLQLGSQMTTPPTLGYVQAYWSSPTHDFVDFLIGVKNKYDPTDVFKFAQSIPLAL